LHPRARPLVAIERADARKDLLYFGRVKTVERIALGLGALGDRILEFGPGAPGLKSQGLQR
jgi:hypothetical protein